MFVARAAVAQQELPPGHPPIGGALSPAPPMPNPAALPPGHPSVAGAAPPSGHPGVGAHGGESAGEDGPRPGAAREDAALPRGTVEVRVATPDGAPVADQPIVLGILASGERTQRDGRTDAGGVARFTALDADPTHAYRVTLPLDGANVRSDPFRLGAAGVHVDLVRYGVTRDTSAVLLLAGQVAIDVGEEGIQVAERLRLVNFRNELLVVDGDAFLLRLPRGFRRFETQPSMTDLRVEEVPEVGARVAGSFPPGISEVVFAYEVPIDGRRVKLGHRLPWRVIALQVQARRTAGMKLAVAGFPPAREHDVEGEKTLATVLERRPGDPPLREIAVTLDNLPGGEPAGRWIAAGIAFALVAWGTAMSLRRRVPGAGRLPVVALERDRAALLAEAAAVARRRARGELGEKAFARERAAIVQELAEVLRELDRRR